MRTVLGSPAAGAHASRGLLGEKLTLNQHGAPAHPVEADVQLVRELARFIRTETIRLIGIAKSGHFTSVFSCAEILAALYSGVMRLGDDPRLARARPADPLEGPLRRRRLPAARRARLLPARLARRATPALGKPARRPPGHAPRAGHRLLLRLARARPLDRTRHGEGGPPARLDATRIYVLLGDQELNEGQVWEAAQAAAHFGLGNLVRDRRPQPDGPRRRDRGRRCPSSRSPTGSGRSAGDARSSPTATTSGGAARVPARAAASRARRCRPASSRARSRARASRYMELSRTWHLGYLAPEDARAATLEIGDDDA